MPTQSSVWSRLTERLLPLTVTQRLRVLVALVALTQLGLLVWLSGYLYSHSNLSLDFYIFEQARYLIAHGVIDPYTSAKYYYYWQNHGEFIMWPLAWLSRVTIDNGFALLLLQSVATAAATYVGGSWLIELWERRGERWHAAAVLAVLGCTVVMLLNPWVYLADSFDFHLQAVDALLIVLTARTLDRGEHRMLWLYVVLMLSTGDVAATYVVALGVSAIVIARLRRQSLRAGFYMIFAGAAWSLLLTALKANQGSNLAQFYAYLAGSSGVGTSGYEPSLAAMAKGAVIHPSRVWHAVGHSLLNDWANAAASGLTGVASVWAFPVTLITEASYSLIGSNVVSTAYSRPLFQSLPLYPIITVGTGLTIFYGLTRRSGRTRVALVAIGFIGILQALGWTAWIAPHLSSTWDLVTANGARDLRAAEARVPNSAEVIAQQGVMGALADRKYMYWFVALDKGQRTYPVKTRPVYFVSSFYEGAEYPSSVTAGLIADAASLPGARLVLARPATGVWVVRWNPPRLVKHVTLRPLRIFPAWITRTNVGTVHRTGLPSAWHVSSDGSRAGYLSYGDYYRLLGGDYRAVVRLRAAAPVALEVWNDSTDTLISRSDIASPVSRTVTYHFHLTLRSEPPLYRGSAIFRYRPLPQPRGNTLELRVYAKRGVRASIYSLGIEPAA